LQDEDGRHSLDLRVADALIGNVVGAGR
jgi:hypothetical protein